MYTFNLRCFLSIIFITDYVTAMNITIMVYGMWAPGYLQNLIFTGPGFDLGVQRANALYGGNISMEVVYVAKRMGPDSDPDVVKFCPDMPANYYQVAMYYYRRMLRDDNRIFANFFAGCDTNTVLADFGREWNMFTISTGSMLSSLRSRELFPTAVAFGPWQYQYFGLVVYRFMQFYNWTSAVLVYDTSGGTVFNLRAAESIMLEFRTNNQHTLDIHPYPLNVTATADYFSVIKEIAAISRVIFLSLPSKDAVKFLRDFAASGEPAHEYARIFLDIPGWQTSPLEPSYNAKNMTKEDKRLLEPVIFLTICFDHEESQVADLKDQMMSLSKSRYNGSYPPGNRPNEFVMTAYTSVLLYAQVVQEHLDAGLDPSNGTSITKSILNRTMTFPRVGSVYVDQYGERQNIFCFLSYQQDTRSYEKFLLYDGATTSLHYVPDARVNWSTPDNNPPPNVPLCGYRKDRPPCVRQDYLSTGALAGIVVSVVLVIIPLVGCFFWRAQHLGTADEWWRLDPSCLSKRIHTSSAKQLSKEQHTNMFYKGKPVWSKTIPIRRKTFLHTTNTVIPITPGFRRVLVEIRAAMDRSNNINPLVGIELQPYYIICYSELCSRGSLLNVLQDIPLDWTLRSSLISDIIEGVSTIHASKLLSHGHLQPSKCLVDNRLTLKISEVGFHHMLRELHVEISENIIADQATWFAPEVRAELRKNALYITPPSADIYAVGELMDCILQDQDKEPFGNGHVTTLADSSIPLTAQQVLTTVIELCRHPDPAKRPTIGQIVKSTDKVLKNSGKFLDKLFRRLEDYAQQLEQAVASRTQMLKLETERCDALLSEMLPRYILIQLRIGHIIHPQMFQSVTFTFTYVTGFDEFIRRCNDSPLDIVLFLGAMFTNFDRIIGKCDCYKVETVNDSCLVASGLPIENEGQHVAIIARLTLELRNAFLHSLMTNQQSLQCGIHTGPCAAGVIGTARPRYCVFGDSVNMTSRLASSSQSGKIHVSGAAAKMLEEDGSFKIHERGLTFLKGIGDTKTYWLDT
ncbi:atrial natriuretic peptide receptor 1-like [Paramacrobiotus metropolitanus]|uniref:atrial natriuretic peptide receptor 1-like n=1 Tax=Paramacrobiotus metropolitanus TaxID=2943436 RepID=UPI002445D74B|nr:atrial natriuretic peptide receptor 1-like [Paramacrobiotus metropolitanus]